MLEIAPAILRESKLALPGHVRTKLNVFMLTSRKTVCRSVGTLTLIGKMHPFVRAEAALLRRNDVDFSFWLSYWRSFDTWLDLFRSVAQ
jgi:hypothetical protein